MAEEKKDLTTQNTSLPSTDIAINREELNTQALELINQIISEKDIEKTKDLTYLFNQNQNKKTIVRVNKLNDLLDTITDQTIARFSDHPDEITTKELLDALKAVQDSVERGQKQVAGVQEQPLIQVNQQNNEIKIGDESTSLNKESRDRIKNAVMALLGSTRAKSEPTTEVIDIEAENTSEGEE